MQKFLRILLSAGVIILVANLVPAIAKALVSFKLDFNQYNFNGESTLPSGVYFSLLSLAAFVLICWPLFKFLATRKFLRIELSPGTRQKLYLGIAIVLAAGILVFLFLKNKKVTLEFIFMHNFLLVYAIVLFLFAITTIKKDTVKKQTWKTIKDVWLPMIAIPAISAGGFSVIGFDTNKDKLLKMTTTLPYVDVRAITLFYIANLVLYLLAYVFYLIGRSNQPDELSSQPLKWLRFSFIAAWITCVDLVSILFNQLILTFHAQLVA